jgi:hypothetical protein
MAIKDLKNNIGCSVLIHSAILSLILKAVEKGLIKLFGIEI